MITTYVCSIEQRNFTDATLAPQSYDVTTCIVIVIEKGRDLTQSYDKCPYTNRNVKRAK